MLSPAEIQYNNDHKDWNPCNKCQEEIDAVFSEDSEEEIDEQLALELGWEESRYEQPEKNT